MTTDDPSDLPWPSSRQGWLWTYALLVAYMSSFVDRQILSLMVGPIKADLHLSDTQFGLLNGLGFAIFYATMGIPLGALVDRYARKTVAIAGIIGWSVMTGLCGLASSYGQLLAARMGVAIGEASLAPATTSLLSDCFPSHKLGRALSVYYLGAAFGAGMAFLLGGAIVTIVDGANAPAWLQIGGLRTWQIVFIAVGMLGLPIALLLCFLKEPPRRGAAQVQAPPSWGEMARTIQDKASFYVPFLGSTMCFSIMSVILLSWTPAFFTRVHGLSIGSVGVMMGLATVVGVGGGVLAGARLAEFLNARGHVDAPIRTTGLMLSLSVPAIVSAMFVDDPRVAACLLSLGMFATSAPAGVCLAAIQTITPNRLRGRMSAFYYLCTNMVGVSVGPLLPALITDYGFHDEARIGHSIALAVLPVGILGPLFSLFARKPFVRFVTERQMDVAKL